MADQRPPHARTVSTNLGATRTQRPLEGKLAIVTGASRGIGKAIAENLAAKGASLVLGYTSESSAKITHELADALAASCGVTCLPVQADMGVATGPAHLVTTAKNHFAHPKSGRFQIDVLVNNAGVAANHAIEEVTVESFHKLYAVNVLGPLLLMQAALPHLPHDRSGRVVNVSSVSSSMGLRSQSVYGGTKAALEAMTRTWARELAERATVNAINPGPVATDMWGGVADDFRAHLRPFTQTTPGSQIRSGLDDPALVKDADIDGGRPAYPEEVAGVVGMLCTADAGWTTGQVVCANGGMRMVI